MNPAAPAEVARIRANTRLIVEESRKQRGQDAGADTRVLVWVDASRAADCAA
jgi:hypothetical protein